RAVGGQPQADCHFLSGNGARPTTAERHLAHEAKGGAIEQLLVFDEEAFDLRLEGLRDSDRGTQGDGTWRPGAELQDDPAAVLAARGHMRDHCVAFPSSAAPVPALEKLRPRSAKDRSLSSTRRLTVPAGKRPSPSRSPALTPVRISIPSSTLATG